jgi:type IV secretory pathway VirJ component
LLADLPLIEVPAPPDTAIQSLVVWLTGDGGWDVTDPGASAEIAARGVPVVGLNCKRYFWPRREPDTVAQDLARVLRHYMDAWSKRQAVLVGYSLGAEVLPFAINRLPADLRPALRALVLLGPGREVDFKYHRSGWMGFSYKGNRPVRPELERLHGLRVLCFYGEGDHGCLCPDLPPEVALAIAMSGGHRVGRHYQAVVDSVVTLAR